LNPGAVVKDALIPQGGTISSACSQGVLKMPVRSKSSSWILPIVIAVACAGGAARARADIVVTGSFGPFGDVGFNPGGPTITLGPTGAGSLFQLDGFINVTGQNLNNGSGFGTSAQLSFGPAANIGYVFSASQPTVHQLLLNYSFTNNTGASLPGFQFLSFADADVGSAAFDREFATVAGTPGVPSNAPTSFQADDPTLGTVFTNVANGALNNTNSSSVTNPIDVATALGFKLAALAPGLTANFQVLLSDDGSSLAGINLIQQNVDGINFPGLFTMSGRTLSVVPEPGSLTLLTLGSVGALVRRWIRKRKKSDATIVPSE
jgi:PEP-CTERM motif